MIKKYVYKDKEYRFIDDIRKAIFEDKGIVIDNRPEINTKEFWESLDVCYSEEKEPVIQTYVPTLDEEKDRAKSNLSESFRFWRNSKATLISSLGFEADADEKAMMDVTGLVALEAPASFMDANNIPHRLTAEKLKILQKEIIQSGNKAYERKWTYRQAIEDCATVAELRSIKFEFLPVDFSKGK